MRHHIHRTSLIYRTSLISGIGAAITAGAALLLALVLAGCGYQPDTSAPERVEIARAGDWQSTLLYVADSEGPTPGFGSVRVYDNVSGLVEMTVEQTLAAAPADVFVTSDGGRLFAASGVNGRVDVFSWNGNGWLRTGQTMDTPASCLSAIKAGPDGRVYASDCSEDLPNARIIAIDPATGSLTGEGTGVPELKTAAGLSWSPSGDRIFVTGTDKSGGGTVLLAASWPAMQTLAKIPLGAAAVSQVETSPQGRFVYVMTSAEILKIDVTANAIAANYKPAGTGAGYVDAAFSADGRDLFVTGGPAGAAGNIYVIDAESGIVVHEVNQIAASAGGIQRVE